MGGDSLAISIGGIEQQRRAVETGWIETRQVVMASDPALKTRTPIRPLSIAWLVTLAALVAFLWCAYDSYRRFSETAQRNLRIQELRGQIIHLDEALTMSARMAALTGDPAWESRYRKLEPELDAAIREVLGNSLGVETTSQTEAANEALVQMEHAALDLARQGKLDQAKTRLFSSEYTKQKAIYSDGMDKLGQQLAQSARSAMETERKRITFQLAGGSIIIVALVVGWLGVVRVVNQGMKARQKLDKVERDLDIARQIQRGLLPTNIPNTPGFEIEGWSQPADQTGGDYFDWMELPDGATLIALADVTGHGIGPALIVAVCRAYMRAATADLGVALNQAMSRVNDLLQMDLPSGRFVTAAVGVLRPDMDEMTLISAGQAPLLFFHAATRKVETWAADDLPLGIAPSITFETARRVNFEPGDSLILATDGFFEWANDGGEQYGIQRLEAFVKSHGHETPAAFIRALHDDVVAHANGSAQPDDLTVVVIKRTAGVAAPGAATERRAEPKQTVAAT